MPKNSTTDIAERRQALLDFLPAEDSGVPGHNSENLKAWTKTREPNVSIKTIQRDLLALLAEHRVVCEEVNGQKRWLRTSGGRTYQPMSRHEAFLHALVNQRLKHLLPASLFQALQPAMLQAENTLARPDLQRERSWFDKVQSAPGLLPPPVIESKLMQTIISALLNEHWLLACYKKRDQQVQDAKRLMPLGIAEVENIYYLVARYDGYDDNRHLRIDRFISAEEEDEPFIYPHDFSLKSYLASGAFRYLHGEPIVLKLQMGRYTSQHLIDQPLSDDMDIQPYGEEECMVTATVSDDGRLFWWLLAMGENVIVLEPASLRNRMINMLQSIQDKYLLTRQLA
ncbi:helix-turn-helix transcriptional regulator [Chitinilyticum piscinae]|uniref:WYL domain-containing protein n=1 Tax=Chitinilyticum piscinae TaxID=2866724 RepID=A0A8J7KC28_9NEIS|nr:WYL domain-containing protein [Chitinilyticum piscinae]MBE9610879.1 WYL domain-containing protein [Chitinilyticum piscinae]